MNKFRKKIKRKLIIFGICEIGIIILLLVLLLNTSTGVDEHAYARQLGCLTGLIVGIGIRLFMMASALKNDEKFNKLYIQENDERVQTIVKNTASTTFIVMIMSLTIAMVVATSYNKILSDCFFYTLIYLLVVYGVTYFYYNRKF